MQLTDTERLLLLNQYRILAIIDPEQADFHEEKATIVAGGFEFDYDELTTELYDPMPADDSTEVREIMEMFWHLERSYKERTGSAELPYGVEFQGFDGNSEGRQFSYARFLVHERHLFQGLEGGRDNFNSHCPSLEGYRAMLPIWNRIRKGGELFRTRQELTEEEIQELRSAQG